MCVCVYVYVLHAECFVVSCSANLCVETLPSNMMILRGKVFGR